MLGWLHKDFSLHVTMAGWVCMDFSLCRDNGSFSSACGERGVEELVTLFLTFIPSHLLTPFPHSLPVGIQRLISSWVFSVFCQSAFAYRLVTWKYNSNRSTQSFAQTVFFLRMRWHWQKASCPLFHEAVATVVGLTIWLIQKYLEYFQKLSFNSIVCSRQSDHAKV